jgi:hypothetical protein
MIKDEPLAFPGNSASNVPGDRSSATQNLRSTIVYVEPVDPERGHRGIRRLTATWWPCHHHARAYHFQSPGLKCRIRVRAHVRGQLREHKLPFRVDNAEVLETVPSRLNPLSRELHEATFPLFVILVAINI